MQQHYDPETLVEFAEGSAANAAEIEAHASSCSECANEIEAHRTMIATLRDPSVWNVPRVSPPPQDRISALSAFKHRLEVEDAEAAELLDRILQGPSKWWANALRKGGVRTAGIVRQLLEREKQLIYRAPLDSLVVTQAACDIADSLSVTEYPSDYVITVRAQAMRDHAYGLSFVGRFRDATAVADRAERLLRQTPIPDYELARLDLVRTNICRHTERIDEAISFATRALQTFERFGDRRMVVTARMYAGAMQFERQQYADALEIWSAIGDDASLAGESARVGLTHNLGICYMELGRLDEAAATLSAAIAEFDILGMDAQRARSRRSLANTLAKAGRHHDAISLLRTVRAEFELLGMESTLHLVSLQLAEELLITGEREEVPAICRALIEQFTRAGMGGSALTALAFLRETLASGHATPAHVRHVYEFIRDVSAGDRSATALSPSADRFDN
jgi:tetratricopeptide (TPR) repeat protein